MRLWEIMFCARINKAAVRRWVSLAGGPLSKLPVFTAAEPKRNPVLTLAQFRQCASQYIFRWRESLCRFPPSLSGGRQVFGTGGVGGPRRL